jgi:hypothetical protein
VVYFGGFLPNWDISRGFSIYINNIAVYVCNFAQCVFSMNVCNAVNSLNITENNNKKNNTRRIRRAEQEEI